MVCTSGVRKLQQKETLGHKWSTLNSAGDHRMSSASSSQESTRHNFSTWIPSLAKTPGSHSIWCRPVCVHLVLRAPGENVLGEGKAQWLVLLPHSKKVLGFIPSCGRAFLWVCMFACPCTLVSNIIKHILWTLCQFSSQFLWQRHCYNPWSLGTVWWLPTGP